MTMPSQANFENNTAEQIIIKPLGKSDHSWKQFTLNPKDKKEVRDSISGVDIAFSVYAKQNGGKADTLIGDFQVDNPSPSPHTWNISRGDVYKATPVSYSVRANNYQTEYSGGNASSNHEIPPVLSDKIGIVGQVHRSKFNFWSKVTVNGNSDTYFYTLDANSAFDKSIPYIEHGYLGDGNGAKTWQFNFKDWA